MRIEREWVAERERQEAALTDEQRAGIAALHRAANEIDARTPRAPKTVQRQCWWCGSTALGVPWRRDPRFQFCDDCGERNLI